MKFCPNCGTSLAFPSTKFCPECGANLQLNASDKETDPHTPIAAISDELNEIEEQETDLPKPAAFDLGRDLEKMTAEIFQKRGWTVKRNYYPPTKSGATTEIDVYIERGKVRKAVECKNYDQFRMVGVKELRDFAFKLSDTNIAIGIAVTSSQFSDDAEKLAESTGIELWDGEKLKETYFASQLGRVVNPSLVHDPTLPVKFDYETVSTFPLKNPQDIRLTSSILFYHPYLLIKYRLQISRKDPTGKSHNVVDQGTYYVDALDGDLVNREKGTLEQLTGVLKSKQERLESKEDKMVAQELETITPETKAILRTSDYEVTVAEQTISIEEAIKMVKNHVVEKNTHDEKYMIKVRGEEEKRIMKIVPKASEVEIRGTHTVYVPKWILEYEAGPRAYTRRFLASSGTQISDELAKCSQCTLVKKQTTAICAQCGRTICEKHAYNEGGRWLCSEHISDELKSTIKDESFVSKLTFWKR